MMKLNGEKIFHGILKVRGLELFNPRPRESFLNQLLISNSHNGKTPPLDKTIERMISNAKKCRKGK